MKHTYAVLLLRDHIEELHDQAWVWTVKGNDEYAQECKDGAEKCQKAIEILEVNSEKEGK